MTMRWVVLRSLVVADGRRLFRDTLLVWMAAVPLTMALVMRCLAEPIRSAVEHTGMVDHLLGLLDATCFVVVVPLVMGTLFGFVVLDEKDSGVLTAIRLTPVSLRGCLAWRAAATGLVTVLAVVLTRPIAALAEGNAHTTLLIATAGAPLAVSSRLGLAAVAANRLRGFALVKLALVVLLLPILGLWLGGGWRWATMWLPSWWPVMVHDAAIHHGPAWIWLTGDHMVNLLLALVAIHRLDGSGRAHPTDRSGPDIPDAAAHRPLTRSRSRSHG